ncbi:MAG: hypothetical protein H6Q22_831, partial [Bacteroidetes bacterium]|nr:hypothetical protein [Bacteroidota bacterium]
MKSVLKLHFPTILFFLLAVPLCAQNAQSFQKLPVAWEELTSSDFSLAVKQSDSLCIIPIGV